MFDYGNLEKVYTPEQLDQADCVERLKRWKQERITKGFCQYDLWDLDIYLVGVIITSLREFADTTSSFPADYENITVWREDLHWLADEFEAAWDMIQNGQPDGWTRLRAAFISLWYNLGNLWD